MKKKKSKKQQTNSNLKNQKLGQTKNSAKLELLSDHPFLISNPENARKMAEFRIFSLKRFQ